MAEYGEAVLHWYTHVLFTQYLIKSWNESSRSGSLDGFIENFDNLPGLNIVLRKSFEEGQIALHISPTSLSTAITLQFFQAISSNFQLQRCAVCPTWFTFGTGTGRRKSALYCSNRCRKAAFLEREKSKKWAADTSASAPALKALLTEQGSDAQGGANGRTNPREASA